MTQRVNSSSSESNRLTCQDNRYPLMELMTEDDSATCSLLSELLYQLSSISKIWTSGRIRTDDGQRRRLTRPFNQPLWDRVVPISRIFNFLSKKLAPRLRLSRRTPRFWRPVFLILYYRDWMRLKQELNLQNPEPKSILPMPIRLPRILKRVIEPIREQARNNHVCMDLFAISLEKFIWISTSSNLVFSFVLARLRQRQANVFSPNSIVCFISLSNSLTP